MLDLSLMHCEHDERRLVALDDEELSELQKLVWGWSTEDEVLKKEFAFASYAAGISFVSKVTMLAEQERYAPVFVLSATSVGISLATPAVGALCRNDFIMAAKIDALLAGK